MHADELRSKSGLIVLLDILFVLILVLAARLESSDIKIVIEEAVVVGDQSDVTIIARQENGAFEYLDGSNWISVTGNEDWTREMLTTDCDARCDQFTLTRHSTSEFLILGQTARNIAIKYANDCRVSSQNCRTVPHIIGKDGYRSKRVSE